VQFTCDTDVTSIACPFSINALTLDGSAIGGVDTQALGSEDRVNRPSSDVLTYDGTTTSELDRLSFHATAGLPIGFDVWLQGEAYPNRFVFWIGDGGLNRGVTYPSFDLYPTPVR